MQNYIVVESIQEEEVAKATEKVKSRLDNILNGGNGDFFDEGVVGLPYEEDEEGYKHYGALPPETIPLDADNPFPMLDAPIDYG